MCRGCATYPEGVTRTSASTLRAARQAAGLTQAELAGRAGVARSVLASYESGAREPSAATFLRILDAAGWVVSIDRPHDADVRRGVVLDDLLALAGELPHRWPGDDLTFPAAVWRRR